MDINDLKDFIKSRRDFYIATRGKFDTSAAAMQEILIKMNLMNNTVVTSNDLICEGLSN